MTSKMLLSFVNEQTQKKFVITDNLDTVCEELGWDKAEVEECGGVTEFMHKHEKAGESLIFG
jgi:NAD-dependent SIR2 family protein deacetylase